MCGVQEPFWPRWFGELCIAPSVILASHLYHKWIVEDAKEVIEAAERRRKEMERQAALLRKKSKFVDRDEPDGGFEDYG